MDKETIRIALENLDEIKRLLWNAPRWIGEVPKDQIDPVEKYLKLWYNRLDPRSFTLYHDQQSNYVPVCEECIRQAKPNQKMLRCSYEINEKSTETMKCGMCEKTFLLKKD